MPIINDPKLPDKLPDLGPYRKAIAVLFVLLGQYLSTGLATGEWIPVDELWVALAGILVYWIPNRTPGE